MEKSENAVVNFKEGLNCSQCVLSAFSHDLELNNKLALKIASGFGGGMCQGEVCGAVTGAIMVLNVKFGNSEAKDRESKEKTYRMIRLFSEKFISINNSIVCRNLLGIDLKEEDNRNIARERGLFKIKCSKFIEDAINILENILSDHSI
ncbi:C-GCAxxG-C-C family protein [Clostridium sp. WILCCON 0269]|uniref:C-GCAxxG-C-C family protein n=1 Tax=Candidatus Clostridium eludens TaxID=3381663 RepID=A0ABW8SJK1_9CLOT